VGQIHTARLSGFFSYRSFSITILPSVTNGLLLNAIVIALLANVALLSLTGGFAIRSFFKQKEIPMYIVREKLSRRAKTRLRESKMEIPLSAGVPMAQRKRSFSTGS
jgi:hypothetical protein